MLESKLGAFAKELGPLLEAAAKAGAEKVAEDARARVPVDTGRLKDAIHTQADEDGFLVIAGNREVFYGHMVEHGTTHSPAHPFLVPALEENRDGILAEMNAAIRRFS